MIGSVPFLAHLFAQGKASSQMAQCPNTVQSCVMKTAILFLVCSLFLFDSYAASAPPEFERRPVRILVVTAVDYEFSAVSSLLRSSHTFVLADRQVSVGEYAGSRVAVIRAGWGKAQAAGATALAIRLFSPKLVIMAGVGGGVNTASITSGDVVIAQSTFQYDLGRLSQSQLEIWPPETPQEQPYPSPNFESPVQLVRRAVREARMAQFTSWKLPIACSCDKDGTLKPGCTKPAVQVDRVEPNVCSGVIASGDAFLVDRSVAERLVSERHVQTVDMETAAVAEEASNNRIPFVGVRVVSDVVNGANEDLYYCLKPFSGARLKQVMQRVLSSLNAKLPTGASDGSLLCGGERASPQGMSLGPQRAPPKFLRVR
jgi:adenosylhomocysteine nucleosidase